MYYLVINSKYKYTIYTTDDYLTYKCSMHIIKIYLEKKKATI